MVRVEPIGSYVLLAFLALVWTAVLTTAATHMNIGLDISDTAYYILSFTNSEEIYSQSTLFGVVWKLISPFDGIIANRYFNLFVVQLSFLFLACALSAYLDFKPLVSVGVVVSFALASSLHYLIGWLPDPSYNSLNLCIIALSWGAFFMLARACQRPGHSIVAWAFVIGVFLASAVLVKATSAGLLGIALLTGYFFVDYSNLSIRRLTILAIYALVGIAIFLLFTSATGFTPSRIYLTMSNGFTAGTLIADPPLAILYPLQEYFDRLSAAPILQNWYPAAFGLCFGIILFSGDRLPMWLRLTVSVALSFAFAAITFSFGYELPHVSFINVCFWFAYVLAIAALTLVPTEMKPRLAGIMLIMALSLGIYSYGTNTNWLQRVSNTSGLAWTAAAMVLAALPSRERLVWAPPMIMLLVSSLAAAAIGAEREPYRLDGPMSAMTSPAKAGPQEETIFVSPQLAAFYNGLAPIRHDIGKLANRPILIDLSGRAPMAAYQIGARVPRTPWILSEYPGSVPVFDLIVGQIPRDDIKQAWILQSSEYQKGFPNDILAKFGVNFPADYVEIVKVPLPYIEATGHLYAPKATINALKEAATANASASGKQP